MDRSFRSTIASFVATALFVLTALIPINGLAQSSNDDVGNSVATRACEQNGWQDLRREDGPTFSSEDACVRYALMGGELQQQRGVMILEFDGPESACSFDVTASGLEPNTTNLYTLWIILRNTIYYSLPIPTDAAGNARMNSFDIGGNYSIEVDIIYTRTEGAATNNEVISCSYR